MQLSWEEIHQQLPTIKVPKMRFEQLQYQGVSFINDAYNANPESMRAALSSLPSPKAEGKRIAVLASMKELGAFSEESHLEIGLFAQRFVDHLLCFGEEAAWIAEAFSRAQKPAEHFMDKQELGKRLMELMLPGDIVLLRDLPPAYGLKSCRFLYPGQHVAFAGGMASDDGMEDPVSVYV